MKGKSDYIFLGILGLCISSSIIYCLCTDYEITPYNYAAVTCLLLTLQLRILRPKAGRYAVAVLIILATLNVINFTFMRTTSSFNYSEVPFISLDPNLLLLLIIYCIVNRKTIISILSGRRAEKRDSDYQQNYNSHIKRFEKMTTEEFNQTMRYYDDHPPEAQAALKQLSDSRPIQNDN